MDKSLVSPCKRFAAVYDGHGGTAVSQYLRNQLFVLLSPEISQLDAEMDVAAKSARRLRVATILNEAVKKLDFEVQTKTEWKFQGHTAVAVLLIDDVIYSVNVGDSRAVLSRNGDAVEPTQDHKPNHPQEQARIESLGGRVQWYGYVDALGSFPRCRLCYVVLCSA
ncbi:unnamed protein product [Phytophthora fragariaefolia]|uniref:Unnamed protein product n=1 Tax=Phytophthora fragariaefolia TaxID=1490495 RepID=A0A9W6Y683_9STRA|nr:unnamed protein product [Phytophthora fragariaefolia]